jgi:hypothetical protein
MGQLFEAIGEYIAGKEPIRYTVFMRGAEALHSPRQEYLRLC